MLPIVVVFHMKLMTERPNARSDASLLDKHSYEVPTLKISPSCTKNQVPLIEIP